MSFITHSRARHFAAVTGLLGLAGLAVPAYAQDITSERALLNVTPAVTYGGAIILAPAPSPRVDGERALLARATATPRGQAVASGPLDARPVDGERALLNRVARFDADRLARAF